jgi:heat shock protein HslJ
MNKIRTSVVGLAVLIAVILSACSASGGLDATSWKLESYADAAGELVDVLPESVVTLFFQAEQVSGSAGCNNYNGSFQATGSKIEFGPIAATKKLCAQPLGIMEQEDAYLTALGAAAEYNLRGNTLEMKDDRGDIILAFIRAAGD